MPLVAAAVLPHAPLLIPGVGREHRGQLQRTLDATTHLAEELYALQPDALVVLTPHGPRLTGSFFVNVAEAFPLAATKFGDLATALTAHGAASLGYRIKRGAEAHHLPITLGTAPPDYGLTVPLQLLEPCLPSARVLAVVPAELPPDAIEAFGRVLGDVLHRDSARAAVIASLELSHRSTPAAPGGETKAGRAYDARVVRTLRAGDLTAAAQADPRAAAEVASCAPPILALLAGVLARRSLKPSLITYEAPFGIGELTALFPLL